MPEKAALQDSTILRFPLCGETVTRKNTVPILDVRLVVCRHCRRHCSLQSFNHLKIKNRHSEQITVHALVADIPVSNVKDLDLNQSDMITTL